MQLIFLIKRAIRQRGNGHRFALFIGNGSVKFGHAAGRRHDDVIQLSVAADRIEGISFDRLVQHHHRNALRHSGGSIAELLLGIAKHRVDRCVGKAVAIKPERPSTFGQHQNGAGAIIQRTGFQLYRFRRQICRVARGAKDFLDHTVFADDGIAVHRVSYSRVRCFGNINAFFGKQVAMRQQKILPYVVVHNQQTIVGEVIIIKGRNVFNGCGLQSDAGKLVVRRQRHIGDLLGNGDGLVVVRDA